MTKPMMMGHGMVGVSALIVSDGEATGIPAPGVMGLSKLGMTVWWSVAPLLIGPPLPHMMRLARANMMSHGRRTSQNQPSVPAVTRTEMTFAVDCCGWNLQLADALSSTPLFIHSE